MIDAWDCHAGERTWHANVIVKLTCPAESLPEPFSFRKNAAAKTLTQQCVDKGADANVLKVIVMQGRTTLKSFLTAPAERFVEECLMVVLTRLVGLSGTCTRFGMEEIQEELQRDASHQQKMEARVDGVADVFGTKNMIAKVLDLHGSNGKMLF